MSRSDLSATKVVDKCRQAAMFLDQLCSDPDYHYVRITVSITLMLLVSLLLGELASRQLGVTGNDKSLLMFLSVFPVHSVLSAVAACELLI
jgi:hypothetical protein